MPRYKSYNLDQTKLLPINFRGQILPSSFEYTLHTVISDRIDLSVFDERFKNDETGERNKKKSRRNKGHP